MGRKDPKPHENHGSGANSERRRRQGQVVERAEADPEAISASDRTVPVSLICIDLLCCIVLSLCFDYRILFVMYSDFVGTRDTPIQEFW